MVDTVNCMVYGRYFIADGLRLGMLFKPKWFVIGCHLGWSEMWVSPNILVHSLLLCPYIKCHFFAGIQCFAHKYHIKHSQSYPVKYPTAPYG